MLSAFGGDDRSAGPGDRGRHPASGTVDIDGVLEAIAGMRRELDGLERALRDKAVADAGRPAEPGEPLAMRRVLATVADELCMPVEELQGRRRERDLCHRRQLAMLVLHQACPRQPIARLARLLKRDHTTVLHGVARARALVEHDPEYARVYHRLRLRLGLEPRGEAAVRRTPDPGTSAP